MSDRSHLLQIQERDSAIDRLKYRSDHLDERSLLNARSQEIGDIDTQLGDVAARIETVANTQTNAEGDAAGISARIETLDKQMYAGTVTAAKDLQAMAHEVESLKERRGAVEERILEIMEQIDMLEEESASLRTNRDVALEAVMSLTVAIAGAEQEIEREIAEQERAREDLVPLVGGELLGRYESLRQRLGGVAVAPLVQGRCEGCHLALSSVALDRIRHASEDSIATCDDCGRMLVPQ